MQGSRRRACFTPITAYPGRVDGLAHLGWDDRWAQLAPAGADVVRVIAEHRGAYHVVGEGGLAWAEITGKRFPAERHTRWFTES